MRIPTRHTDDRTGMAAHLRHSVLSFDNVSAGYGKKEVLRDFTLSIMPGEIVALFGVNGAGKSTALKVAAGLLMPWSGRVLLDNDDLGELPAFCRARTGIGFLWQGGRIFPSLTVRENLWMGAILAPHEHRNDAMEDVWNLYPALRRYDSQPAGLLSGGQRQALAMGMVLVQRPRILLLDEPSAGLSPDRAREMLEAVLRERERRDVTILLVEQRVREALGFVDRAVWMSGGRVVAHTSHPQKWLESGALEGVALGTIGNNPKKVTHQ